MQNYINYFTEIEEHFQRRRGTVLLLSTLDWALIESWREGGIPLAAVLRGIDSAFDKYDARKRSARTRKVNGLAWCAQAIVAAVEEWQEASAGAAPKRDLEPSGLESERIASFLETCATEMRAAEQPTTMVGEVAERLRELADAARRKPPHLEELERTLSVLEEKLLAALQAQAPEAELLQIKEAAARELAPVRSRMQAVQLRQIERQFIHRRLLERYKLPRISLFYMPQS